MKHLILAALMVAAPAAAQISAADAVSAPGRAPADVALDAGRKPAEMLGFAGLKPGDHVFDVMAGGGYYSRLAAAVVGPKGAVFAFVPDSYLKDAKVAAGWEATISAAPQVKVVKGVPDSLAFPAGLVYCLRPRRVRRAVVCRGRTRVESGVVGRCVRVMVFCWIQDSIVLN